MLANPEKIISASTGSGASYTKTVSMSASDLVELLTLALEYKKNGFVTSGNNTAKETDELTKAFAQTCSYVTFVDMDSCYKKFIQETNGTLESFFKDATHPKNENYKYLMFALEEAGCVIADKN